jgi:TPR repeat protein
LIQKRAALGSDITPSLSDLSPTIMAIRVGVALITYERGRWIQLSTRTVYQSTYGSNSATTDSASGETVGVYDMGVPWNPPPHIVTPEEIKIKAKKRAEQEKKAVQWLLSQATNGSASVQCSLGLRYLKGQGVETNEALGRMWLEKATAQGDTEASNKLAELDAARINSEASAISATNSGSQSPQSP